MKHVKEGPKRGYYFDVPDEEAIPARWKKLYETDPNLIGKKPYELDIKLSAGIAGHLEFVEAFFTPDVLLSIGKENMHDHVAHMMPNLAAIYESEKNRSTSESKSGRSFSYQEGRLVAIKEIGKGYRRIIRVKEAVEKKKIKLTPEQLQLFNEHIEKLEATLGVLVDFLSSLLSYDKLPKGFMDQQFRQSWTNPIYERFWKREAKDIDDKSLDTTLQNLWDLTKEIEEQLTQVQE